MKRFVFELTVVLILIAISCVFLYRIDKPIKIAQNMTSIESPLEIVNLGTSHGNSFDYSECPINGMNANTSGNTIYYDLQNYNYLAKNKYLTENAIVIIPVSYFVFGLGENRPDKSDDSFVNAFYYYLPKNSIYSYSTRKKINLTLHVIQKNLKEIIKKIVNREKPKNNMRRFMNEADLFKHSVRKNAQHKTLSEYRPPEKNIGYLKELLKAINDNDHRAILVNPPYHRFYNDHFDTSAVKTHFQKIIENLSSEFGVPYLDYSNNENISNNPQFFTNSDHLNFEGRKAFSSLFFEDILVKEQVISD